MSKRKMALSLGTNPEDDLKAIAVNVKDGFILTVDRVEEPLPTRGYEVHFYSIMTPDKYTGLSKSARIELATVAVKKQLVNEVYNGTAYFVRRLNHKVDITMWDTHIVTPFSIYDQVFYHTQNMLMGFFGSTEYREFVQTHSREHHLKVIMKHEKEAVSRHQKRINTLKGQLENAHRNVL